ncbi:pyridoxal-phosphate dependent enzyme (plasmid) [Agrobacterium salinitolerans]|uniref:threonine ammonia-lyase n=1 Tax=Agrobacterium salinitolerans TaxID=1183413 RepID=UPI001C21A8D3|nr:pyridoxal-phosphate dependent enzyme [Agrobacterium salinitolerans]QXC52510.1 pyridoxal-phosphate dependent enzyme [Agrobacterium salinitolerans]
MTDLQHLPGLEGILAAYDAIDPRFLDTPLVGHGSADAALGLALHAKVETLNPIRAFKGRGTDWLLETMPAAGPSLVTASAGNFGQGLAHAAAKRGRKAIVFAASNANPLKITAMQRLGAEVILHGEDFDAAKAESRRFAEAKGHAFIEDGAHPAIAEGAGTIALELTRQAETRGIALDAILVPLGNGALLTGVGTWIKAKMPSCRVIGVVAETAPAMLLSWQRGICLGTPTAPTIADGIAVREPVPYALDSMKTTVDEVWTVSDDTIRAAMRFCHTHYGVVIEPAGAAGVAAALQHRQKLAGKTVATILCGGNLTPEQLRDYLGDDR